MVLQGQYGSVISVQNMSCVWLCRELSERKRQAQDEEPEGGQLEPLQPCLRSQEGDIDPIPDEPMGL